MSVQITKTLEVKVKHSEPLLNVTIYNICSKTLMLTAKDSFCS